ncbi:hypothetical protein [Haloferula sp.]|uniref:hypothetical protein n=1 Tax=Haloferula sp. TaxID=2497595 RepID=UPI0032A0829B
MPVSTRFFLSVTLLLIPSAHAVVEDWFIDKAISFRQSADDTQPAAATDWTIEVAVETTNPSEANSVSISRNGSAVSHPLEFEDGEWIFEKNYASEAAMNLEFPSSSNYTITLSGGTLGTKIQTFTLGAANYPDTPYLTGHDFTRCQSIEATADFTISWNNAGTFGNSASLEIEDPVNEQTIAEPEFDDPVLPTSFIIAANTLEAGYWYDGYLSLANLDETNGIGGFNTPGFIQHSSNLSFSLHTVLLGDFSDPFGENLPPQIQSIVGAWQFGDGAANGSGVLVFQPNGVYFHAEDAEGTEQDDIEIGTYTWSEAGEFTATPTVDENGDIGLSDSDGPTTINIDGNTMTFTDNAGSFQLQKVAFNPSSWIEGGWQLCDNSGADKGAIVFLDNGTYFHAELAEGDPAGTNGIERGTYEWNQESGVLTTTEPVDTNLELGLSNPLVAPDIVTFPGPRVMSLNDSEQFYLHRISNATVEPGWRLNKSRNFTQTSNNSPPGTVNFWDVYALVETRNATDATQITLSGGGLASPVSLTQEDPGEWTYDKDYNNEALLDSEFPNSQIFTFTLSGGALGTLTQEINTTSTAYPKAPYLTGSDFTDAQSLDPTADFLFNWVEPEDAAGNPSVHFIISSLPDEEGTEFFDVQILGDISINESAELPALSMPAGQTGYGYLEFGRTNTPSGIGKGGFRVDGFSGRQSITSDLPVITLSPATLVGNAATTAGLSGPDAEMDATPFNDGVENILKFAFNMDLAAPDSSSLTPGSGSSGLPVFELDDNGPEPEFKVEFIRRKGSGLVYTAKRSSNLGDGSFTPMVGAVTVTPIPGNDQFERVEVTEPCNPETVPRCFGIVEVTAP